jgi:RNA polymerase sigma factor (sigma-70 family)
VTEDFEAHRLHLRAVAYRMLGSLSDAEDAVQETWLRLNGSDTAEVANLGGWLTTVLARECLHMLRARPNSGPSSEPASPQAGPEEEALLAESVGLALLVVLDRLAPAERVAFVLHDGFALPFDEIAPIVGRSAVAARQLASRARRRVRGAQVPRPDLIRQRHAVEAFLAASRDGDFDRLLALLDPQVVVRADGIEVAGAQEVGRRALSFSHLSRHAQVALVDGEVGIVVAPRGRLSTALTFEHGAGGIVHIGVISHPDRLGRLDLEVLAVQA